MSASTQTQTASTDSNNTVLVIPTGIAGNPRYIADMDAMADEISSAVNGLAGNLGQSMDEVVVRGSYEIAEAVGDLFGSDGPEVDSYSLDFRMFLDDPAESGNGYSVEGVAQEGDKPIVAAVAKVHDMTADEIEAFDLSDRDDRNLINYEVLQLLEDENSVDEGEREFGGSARIGRAKAKSKAKATERLLSDYFDSLPTAQHVLIIEDGTDSYTHAAGDVRGQNDWVKFASKAQGEIRSVRPSGGVGGVLDWTRALLESNREGGIEADDLTDEQEADLRERLSDEELENVGLGVEEPAEPVEPETPQDDSRPVAAEAAAVAGNPADD
jgi:hypothetical protein